MMNTNQGVQMSNPVEASSTIPAKRKRGRPRKYPKLNARDGAHIPRIHRMRREENPSVGGPPGFGGVNGNQPRPVASSSDGADSMVGRAVSGVIEAVFDAGYLLNVRVANSETSLRGVVFRPGRFVPVSAENDVAPDIQMIRRNEINTPTELYNARPRERNDLLVNPHRGKQVPLVACSESVIPRANLVPVVLEPGKSLNGSHVGDPKGKLPQEEMVVSPSNGSTPVTQVPTFGIEAVLSEPRNAHQLVAGKNENCSSLEAEGKPAKPFENLVTEVIKRIETPASQPTEAWATVDDSLPNKKPPEKIEHEVDDAEHEVDDADQALNIEPLQAVLLNDNTSDPKRMDVDRTGKMSQLFEGTALESSAPHGIAPQLTETPSLVTELREKKPVL